MMYTNFLTLMLIVKGCSAICDPPAAELCLDQIVALPAADPTEQQCQQTMDSLVVVDSCVRNADCTDPAAIPTVTAVITTLKTDISSGCGGGCTNLGELWLPYSECDYDNLDSVLQSVKTAWNAQNSDTVPCSGLQRIVVCLRSKASNCTKLREAFGRLYEQHPSLKMAQEICGIEHTANHPSYGAIITGCDQNLDTVVNDVIMECPLDVNYTSTDVDIFDICRQMQIQIDCVLEYQSSCPDAVTRFLQPRLDSYSVASTLFCGNVSIHGLYIRPLPTDCDYHELYDCFRRMMYALGQSKLNKEGLKAFFQWNIMDAPRLCDSFIAYDVDKTASCASTKSESCIVASPTFGYFHYNAQEAYDEDLYRLFESGPTPFNQFGARFIADRQYYICGQDCDMYSELKYFLDETCIPLLKAAADAVIDAEQDPDTIATACYTFEQQLVCLINTSLRCPIFSHRAEELLTETHKVGRAVSICELGPIKLLPDNFLPTVQPSVASTTTTEFVPGSTTTDPRTQPRRTTPETSPTQPPSTTLQGSISHADSPVPSPCVVVVLSLIACYSWLKS